MSSPGQLEMSASLHLFPPALAPILRQRFGSRCPCLEELTDELLVQLLTTVFFAGLETYEGEHHSTGIVFLGSSLIDVVLPEAEAGVPPLYRWKVNRFETPRPFAIRELVKLSVAGTERPIYSAVHVLDGRLVITGLAREGMKSNIDPFVKVITGKPGCLSIRSGRDLLLGYERGTVITGSEDVIFPAGPVRRVLEETARAAGLHDDGVIDYLDAVRSMVREMASHGRGGILIVTPDEDPPVEGETATYRMAVDSSLGSMLRLARFLENRRAEVVSSNQPAASMHTSADNDASRTRSFSQLLRNAFFTEVDRVIEEFGALTGIDGATLLNRDLGLVGFGVILPVGRPAVVIEVTDDAGLERHPIDLGDRGTRHRASATYATEHPASVVFVAGEDGQVSCMFRPRSAEEVLLWRLNPVDGHVS